MENEHMDMIIDKEPFIKQLTDDNIINLTGEGGSGKTTYAEEHFGEGDIVIDYDEIIAPTERIKPIELEIRNMLIEKYGKELFAYKNIEDLKKNFTIIYQEILNHFSNTDKRLILDGTQIRFIEDIKMIKGTIIALRPSIKTCLERSVMRYKKKHPDKSDEEIRKYYEHRSRIFEKLTPLLNELIDNVNKLELDKGIGL